MIIDVLKNLPKLILASVVRGQAIMREFIEVFVGNLPHICQKCSMFGHNCKALAIRLENKLELAKRGDNNLKIPFVGSAALVWWVLLFQCVE